VSTGKVIKVEGSGDANAWDDDGER
jgi:hypothetical protein